MVSKKRERGQQKRHAPQSQVDTSTGAWQQASASASAQPAAQQAETHSSAHARAYNLTRASNRLARAVRYAQSRVENFDARKSKIKRKKLKQALKRAKAQARRHARKHARKHARATSPQLTDLEIALQKIRVRLICAMISDIESKTLGTSIPALKAATPLIESSMKESQT